MCNSQKHNSRPNRESLSKRMGRVARAIKARDGYRCQYCGATAASSGTHLQLDHLTTRSRGGLDLAENLVLSCRPCNSARQDLSLAAWSRKAAAELGLAFTATSIRARARRALPAVA